VPRAGPSPADDRGGIEVDTSLVAVVEDDRCSLIEAINNANAGADTSRGDCWSGWCWRT
jgi:hypothetical protein